MTGKIISKILVVCFMLNVCQNFAFAASSQSIVQELSIPQDIGQITDSYKGASSQIIYCIENLHCHKEAQENISKIIYLLKKRFGSDLSWIGVEGSAGGIDTSVLGRIKDKDAREKITQFFLGLGYITGPELYTIRYPKTLKLYGIETNELYNRNFLSLYNAVQARDRSQALFNKLYRAIDRGRELLYTPELIKFEKLQKKYNDCRYPLNEYIEYLKIMLDKLHIDHSINYPNFELYIKKNDLAELNSAEVSAEAGLVTAQIMDIIPDADYAALKDFKNKAANDYYKFLKEIINRNNININIGQHYPSLSNYFKYQDYLSNINETKLLAEVDDIAFKIKGALAKGKGDAEKLVYCERYVKLFDRYLENSASVYDSQKWEENEDNFYKNGRDILGNLIRNDGFDKFTANIRDIEKNMNSFYSLANKRNEEMLNNMFQRMAKAGSKVNVMVTGGYHTQGIKELLAAKGISYIVIRPVIRESFDKKIYVKRLCEQAHWQNVTPGFIPCNLAGMLELASVFGQDAILPVIGIVAETVMSMGPGAQISFKNDDDSITVTCQSPDRNQMTLVFKKNEESKFELTESGPTTALHSGSWRDIVDNMLAGLRVIADSSMQMVTPQENILKKQFYQRLLTQNNANLREPKTALINTIVNTNNVSITDVIGRKNEIMENFLQRLKSYFPGLGQGFFKVFPAVFSDKSKNWAHLMIHNNTLFISDSLYTVLMEERKESVFINQIILHERLENELIIHYKQNLTNLLQQAEKRRKQKVSELGKTDDTNNVAGYLNKATSQYAGTIDILEDQVAKIASNVFEEYGASRYDELSHRLAMLPLAEQEGYMGKTRYTFEKALGVKLGIKQSLSKGKGTFSGERRTLGKSSKSNVDNNGTETQTTTTTTVTKTAQTQKSNEELYLEGRNLMIKDADWLAKIIPESDKDYEDYAMKVRTYNVATTGSGMYAKNKGVFDEYPILRYLWIYDLVLIKKIIDDQNGLRMFGDFGQRMLEIFGADVLRTKSNIFIQLIKLYTDIEHKDNKFSERIDAFLQWYDKLKKLNKALKAPLSDVDLYKKFENTLMDVFDMQDDSRNGLIPTIDTNVNSLDTVETNINNIIGRETQGSSAPGPQAKGNSAGGQNSAKPAKFQDKSTPAPMKPGMQNLEKHRKEFLVMRTKKTGKIDMIEETYTKVYNAFGENTFIKDNNIFILMIRHYFDNEAYYTNPQGITFPIQVQNLCDWYGMVNAWNMSIKENNGEYVEDTYEFFKPYLMMVFDMQKEDQTRLYTDKFKGESIYGIEGNIIETEVTIRIIKRIVANNLSISNDQLNQRVNDIGNKLFGQKGLFYKYMRIEEQFIKQDDSTKLPERIGALLINEWEKIVEGGDELLKRVSEQGFPAVFGRQYKHKDAGHAASTPTNQAVPATIQRPATLPTAPAPGITRTDNTTQNEIIRGNPRLQELMQYITKDRLDLFATNKAVLDAQDMQMRYQNSPMLRYLMLFLQPDEISKFTDRVLKCIGSTKVGIIRENIKYEYESLFDVFADKFGYEVLALNNNILAQMACELQSQELNRVVLENFLKRALNFCVFYDKLKNAAQKK
ncbi:MAG: hypothetical protein ABH857_01725 [Elusimicrobiota bacterium]